MATSPMKAPAPPEAWQPDHLRPFPAVAIKALNLMAGTNTSLLDLCNLIRPDVAFSAEVLRIANSPLIAFSKSVSSVVQASMLLGFRRLRSVVITVGLKAYLADPYSPLLRKCWHHCLASAIIAERAAKWNSFDKDSAYTAGIMHDIGRVAMAVSMPQSYARVIERGADHPHDVLESERQLCGLDHCAAGRALVTSWGLPDDFLEITAEHHRAEPGRGIASILHLSCALADALGFAVVRYRAARGYAEIAAEFDEPARSYFPADGRDLATAISGEINLIESS
jgi:putative nucleotidyltransferase with HDIG domain